MIRSPTIRKASAEVDLGDKIIKAKGKTILEARDNYNEKSAENVFLGATQAVIFSESFATKGIEEYMNRIFAIKDFKKTAAIVTTHTELEKLMHTGPHNSLSTGFEINNILSQLEGIGESFHVRASEVYEEMAVKRSAFLSPTLTPWMKM